MAREEKVWYFTFKPKQRWTRFSNRYFIIFATSRDLAIKQMIGIFGRDWENCYSQDDWFDESIPKRLKFVEYEPLEEREIRLEISRQNRIKYKVYRESEAEEHAR